MEDFDLSFRLSESEFCSAHRSYLQSSLLNLKNLVLLSTALAIGAIQAQMFGGTDWALRVFGGLWLAVIGLMLWSYLFLPGRLFRKSERHSSEQRLRTEDDGFLLEQAGVKNYVAWTEVSRVTETRDAVLLHRKNQVPILIPFRAFDSADARTRFHERVDRARMAES